MATLPAFPDLPPPPAADEPRAVVVEAELVPLLELDERTLDDLVAHARLERALTRDERRHRVTVIHLDAYDEPWFARPWFKLAAAAVTGYALGRSRALRVLATVAFGATLAAAIERALAHGGPVPVRG